MVDLSGFKHNSAAEVWNYLREQSKNYEAAYYWYKKISGPDISPNVGSLNAITPLCQNDDQIIGLWQLAFRKNSKSRKAGIRPNR